MNGSGSTDGGAAGRPGSFRWRSSWRSLVPVLAVLVVVGAATVWWIRDDTTVEPVAITAIGPIAATLDELVAMSDVVVEAEVRSVADGRSISDDADPTAGIRTQLAELEVTVVHVGDPGAAAPLVVEQESALLDGTPVVVNGLRALAPGDRGVFFLVAGDGDEFPYHALIGDQGWIPVVADTVRIRSEDDPLALVWDGRERSELAAALGSG